MEKRDTAGRVCRQRGDGADVLPLATELRRPDGVGQAKRLKDMEHENTRLKKLVAKLSLDNATLTYNSGPVSGVGRTVRSNKPFNFIQQHLGIIGLANERIRPFFHNLIFVI